jgi:hypothetical protein
MAHGGLYVSGGRCRVAHFDEEQDPDQRPSKKAEPVPHPSDADPQHCMGVR